MRDDDYEGALLEEIKDQNKAVLEAVGMIKEQVKQLPTRDEFNALKEDVRTIKTVVTDMNHDIKDYDRRITRLEEAKV
jgi:Tfp pilus assembly protein PilO